MGAEMMIEVAYAKAEEQVILTLAVETECTVGEAIEQSGILGRFPEIDLERQGVGVFGEPRELKDGLKEGDRVEIYRELLVDPKEARRIRAKGK